MPGVLDSLPAMGTAWVMTTSSASVPARRVDGGCGREQESARASVVEPASSRMLPAWSWGIRARAASAMRIFLVRALDGPFDDAFLGGAEAVRGDGAAVDPAHGAGDLQGGEVAADGFGGDAEALGEQGHADPAAAGDKLGDHLLALFGEHLPSIA